MQIEVKSVLADIKYFSEVVSNIRFYKNPSRFIENQMPRIDQWSQGDVTISVPASETRNVIDALAKYGIAANGKDGTVGFKCKAGDDIISLLSDAIQSQIQSRRSYHLKTIHEEVERLADRIPFVHSSLLSRGVKDFRHSVEVLDNIRKTQLKDLQR